jgi:hypothetical protein
MVHLDGARQRVAAQIPVLLFPAARPLLQARSAVRSRRPEPRMKHTQYRIDQDSPSIARAPAAPALAHLRLALRALLLGTLLAGCQPDLAGDGGGSGMFGLFKGKAAKLPSVVAPQLGAALKREAAFPAASPALPRAAYDHCKPTRVAGVPPASRFVGTDADVPSQSGWQVSAHGAQPPLALVNVSGLKPHLEVWELGTEAAPTFLRQRTLQVDPGQSSWGVWRVLDAACLPGDRLAIGMAYANPRAQHALYVYDIAGNAFAKIGDAVRDSSGGLPGRLFETWPVGPDSALVLWHSGEIRVKAEVYVRERDHFTLFSPRHPQGLELLTLGLDDGNVERWAMVGHTLWLQTVDARNIEKPTAFAWSLDLAKAL